MRFAALDVYPKTLNEFRQKTTSGAIVSITCAALISLLTCVETADFLSGTTDDHLFVDTTRGSTIRINLNMSFPALPCSTITLDTLDISGNHAPDVMRNMSKTRLDKHGLPLPDFPVQTLSRGRRAETGREPSERHLLFGEKRELGPALLSLSSREDAMLSALLAALSPHLREDKAAIEELRRHVGEGCNLAGSMVVNRVAGHFHFALTHEEHATLMAVYKERDALNVSHTIHALSFGDQYPGLINPLDGKSQTLRDVSGFFQYYLKIVPTIYAPRQGPPVHTNQYSYSELFRTTREVDKMPAVYFHYEISPIMAMVTEGGRSFSSFLTGLCAIVGGVFTVAGMCDACIFRLTRHEGSRAK